MAELVYNFNSTYEGRYEYICTNNYMEECNKGECPARYIEFLSFKIYKKHEMYMVQSCMACREIVLFCKYCKRLSYLRS